MKTSYFQVSTVLLIKRKRQINAVSSTNVYVLICCTTTYPICLSAVVEHTSRRRAVIRKMKKLNGKIGVFMYRGNEVQICIVKHHLKCYKIRYIFYHCRKNTAVLTWREMTKILLSISTDFPFILFLQDEVIYSISIFCNRVSMRFISTAGIEIYVIIK